MTQTSTAQGKKPTHRFYIVKGTGKSAKWMEIGAAWPHADGKGFGLTDDALGLAGRLVLREVSEHPARKQRV